MICNKSSPTDPRPTRPSGRAQSRLGIFRPTDPPPRAGAPKSGIQRGEARGSEIVGDHDLGDLRRRVSDRPTPSDRPRMGRKRPDRPTRSGAPPGRLVTNQLCAATESWFGNGIFDSNDQYFAVRAKGAGEIFFRNLC